LLVSVWDSPAVAAFASQYIVERNAIGDRAMSIVNQANLQISEESKRVCEMVLNADIRLRKNFPSWRVRSAILSGNPAAELIKKAEKWHADLIVLGSQGRSAIGRLILGSVSLEVATKAHCMVRIGRRAAMKSDRTQLRILIGLNCSANAEKAIRKVLMRAWPAGTELRIVAVDDGVSTITTKRFEDGSVMEGKFVKVAESKGLIVSAGIKEGDPEQILLAEAREWEADCIVVGSSAARNPRGLFSSSVSAGIAANARCSVEIIR
jgi:nucleotide-binding universal stress UspA family protein